MHAETSSPSLSRVHAGVFVTDPERFEALYRNNVRFVWRNLSRLGIPHDELEDACQEVFATVHRTRERFEGRGGVRSWLYGIVRRVASRHRRTFHRRRRRHEAYADLPEMEVHEPTVAHGLLTQRLQSFLDELDDDKRDVFVLAELEELTANEISRRLGVKPNTIYSRLRAARIAFEARFGPLPRQRDSVRAAHRADAPTREEVQRGWIVLLGLPAGGGAWSASSTAWLSSKVVLLGGIAVATILSVAISVGDLRAGEERGRSRRPSSEEGRVATTRPGDDGAIAAAERGEPPPLIAADVGQPVGSSEARPPAEREVARPARGHAPRRREVASASAEAEAPANVSAAPIQRATPPSNEAAASESTAVAPTPLRASAITSRPAGTARVDPPAEQADPPPPPDSISAEELDLLGEARRALDDGHPTRALAKLRQHARRFPASHLALERTASTAEAHCALARPGAAEPHLQLLEHHNRRALAERIRSRCAPR